MRTIECDLCGATVTADDDNELRVRLAAHLDEEHDETLSDDELGDTIADEAYDASDS